MNELLIGLVIVVLFMMLCGNNTDGFRGRGRRWGRRGRGWRRRWNRWDRPYVVPVEVPVEKSVEPAPTALAPESGMNTNTVIILAALIIGGVILYTQNQNQGMQRRFA